MEWGEGGEKGETKRKATRRKTNESERGGGGEGVRGQREGRGRSSRGKEGCLCCALETTESVVRLKCDFPSCGGNGDEQIRGKIASKEGGRQAGRRLRVRESWKRQ